MKVYGIGLANDRAYYCEHQAWVATKESLDRRLL